MTAATQEKWFRGWARLVLRHPILILSLALVTMLASMGVTYEKLRFSTDRTQLLDPEHPIQRSWKAFRTEFGGNVDIVVLIAGEGDEVKAACGRLADLLLADSAHFQEVFYRLELPEVGKRALYFLSIDQLRHLDEQLRWLQPWMLPAQQGVVSLLDSLTQLSDREARAHIQPILPLLAKVQKGLIASLESRGTAPYQSPLPVFRPESKMLEGQAYTPGQTIFYNQVRDERTCMMMVKPRDCSGSFQADSETIAHLRHLVQELMRSHPRVQCMVSGEPVINTDEMVGGRDDACNSGITAIVLVCVLLTLAFRDTLRPALATFSLLVGLTWSLAFAALTVGTLNLLTVHFATILVGLSMTFAIQLLGHYQELRAGHPSLENSAILEETLAQTGPQSFIGAVTTAVAFWSLHFTNFRAAGELGLITGTGVLLTFLSVLTLLPILLSLFPPHVTQPLRIPGFATLGELLQRRPWEVLGISLFITLYSLTWIGNVPFNYNVLSLQAKGSDSVRVEGFLQSLGYSSLFAVTTAPSMEEAYRLAQRFESLGTVAHVESVAQLMPRGLEQKRPIIADILARARYFKAVPPLSQGLPPRVPGTAVDSLGADQLLELNRRFTRAADRLDKILNQLPPSSDRKLVQSQTTRLRQLLDPALPGPVEDSLQAYQEALTADLERQSTFLHQQESAPPDLLNSLPAAFRSRSISVSGNICLRIFPTADCWEREPLERFVKQLQRVDPKVTGTPLLIYYYLEELRNAYAAAGRNALAVICILLLIHFRSFREAGLALFPKLLGVVWMIGLMGLSHVSFNAANFLALPITLGIGLIFGVNILLECRSGGVAGLLDSSTGAAVLLSGLTAIIGFSSFLMASHLGVSSFGFVMAAGVGANLLTSLFTLPALLNRLESRNEPRGRQPLSERE